jgi:hypothetical protein
VGNLFANTATIRVIKASSAPGIRDSVPPSSALRFEPTSRKRGRESSPTVNGSAPPNSYKPNKRQRLTSLNPDQPLPSREGQLERGEAPPDNGRIPDINVIPSSQESVILGTNYGFYGTSRQVRPDLPQIPETPSPSPPSSPSPPPAFNEQPYYEKYPTDHQGRKPAISNNETSSHNSEADNSNPLKQASVRAQSHGANQSRAKSASYHIPRATERGTSVSTAATSPLSTDHQHSARNGLNPRAKQKISDSSSNSGRQNGKQTSQSPDEDSIYENIVSGDDSAAILNAKKATLKIRKSQNSSLPGIEWANNQSNTPPNGRRNSRPREQESAATPGELPLTPNSKEREQKQRDADNAKNARLAAAQAAEQRKREAEEAKAAKEERVAAQNRARREEQERIEVENFRRDEAERAAVIAKAARLQKEREERERKEAEEEERREERLKEEERLEREKAAKQKEDGERLKRNKALLAEVTRKEEERIRAEKAAEEAKKLKEQAQAAKERLSSPEQARKSSPAIAPGSDRRPQSSSTSFIPSGRKSSLKPSIRSSKAITSSSPAAPTVSPGRTSNGVGLEAQMPLPRDKARRVSFEEPPKKETPIRPPGRILPPGKSTTPIPVPKPATTKPGQKIQSKVFFVE